MTRSLPLIAGLMLATLLTPLASEAVVDPARISIEGSFDLLAEPPAGAIQSEASQFTQARLGYEQISLLAQEIAFRLRGLPDGSGSVLHTARLLGSAEELVRFDTRATRLARIPARVLIQAPNVDITEIEAPQRDLGYRIVLEEVRPVSGTVLVDAIWRPVQITAADWSALLSADLRDGRLVDPALERVRLDGDPVQVDLELPEGSVRSHSRQLTLYVHPQHGLDRVLSTGAAELTRSLPRPVRAAAGDADPITEDRFTVAAEHIELPLLHAGRTRSTGSARGALSLTGPDLLVLGDSLEWRLQQEVDADAAQLEAARLTGTAEEAASCSVQAGRWPLRGRLQAQGISLERLPEETAGQQRYRVQLDQVSDLAGAIRRQNDGEAEWLPFSGRAATIAAEVVHEPASGLIRPVHIRFEAGPDDDVDLTIAGGSWPGRMIGDWIAVHCDAAGEPDRIQVSPDMRFQGLPADPQ